MHRYGPLSSGDDEPRPVRMCCSGGVAGWPVRGCTQYRENGTLSKRGTEMDAAGRAYEGISARRTCGGCTAYAEKGYTLVEGNGDA